jgi:ABC-2 type transporter
MKVFVRERLNGYYGVLPYTAANTLASAPFLTFMAILCSVVVYFLADLNSASDRVAYFMLNLWVALLVVRAAWPQGCRTTPVWAGPRELKACKHSATERLLIVRECTCRVHSRHVACAYTCRSRR